MKAKDQDGRVAASRVQMAITSMVVALLFLAASAGSAVAASASSSAGNAVRASGAIALKVVGLPGGERARVLLTGPRASGHGRATQRLSVGGRRILRRLPVGSYRVTILEVKMRRRHQSIKRGAVASPEKRRYRVKVQAKRAAKLEVRYGTILNPGVVSVTGKVAAVIGNSTAPRGVVLKRAAGIRPGATLSAHPSARLPRGLLARVTSVQRKKGRLTAMLVPASIYDVAPNMSFDVPLSKDAAARASAALKCGPSGSSFSPYARIDNIRLTGGWTTTRWRNT